MLSVIRWYLDCLLTERPGQRVDMSDPELSAVSVLFVKLANWPSAFLIIKKKKCGAVAATISFVFTPHTERQAQPAGIKHES